MQTERERHGGSLCPSNTETLTKDSSHSSQMDPKLTNVQFLFLSFWMFVVFFFLNTMHAAKSIQVSVKDCLDQGFSKCSRMSLPLRDHEHENLIPRVQFAGGDRRGICSFSLCVPLSAEISALQVGIKSLS